MHLETIKPTLPVRRTLLGALIIVLMATVSAGSASASTDGKLGFVRDADSSFDSILSGSAPSQRQWMRDHYTQMRGYSPYFDQALDWASPTQFYRDLYAIHNDSSGDQLISQHPDWVLREASGNKLYVQYGCSGGTCPQYAADIGNPAFRSYWINRAAQDLAKGYRGIFIDDVNLGFKVSNGSGAFTRPIDPRTGAPMTDADWRRYVAEFTEAIRAAFPSAELTHNTYWRDHSTRTTDPYALRELAAADVVEVERGFNDAGIGGGTGGFGYETFLAHMDWLHSRGVSIMYEPYGLDATSREFEIASYYLVKDRSDRIVSNFHADPGNWWADWNTDLGAPGSTRYKWNGLIRRDFASGTVLVNQPGAATVTVALPSGTTWTDLAGNPVTSVTLGARRGKVLLKASSAPTADTTPPETTITSGPAPTITSTSADFGISSSEAGSSFECRLDGSRWSPCTSPKSYTGLAAGTHTFEARATDAAGNTDESPAARSFTVDTTTSTTTGPGKPTIKPRKPRVQRVQNIVLSGTADSTTVDVVRGQGGSLRTLAEDVPVTDQRFRVAFRARTSGRHRYRAVAAGLGRSSVARVRVTV
jgi:Hypothetical glycosyl hydrolase family 15